MPWKSLSSPWGFLLSFTDWRSLDQYFNISSPYFCAHLLLLQGKRFISPGTEVNLNKKKVNLCILEGMKWQINFSFWPTSAAVWEQPQSLRWPTRKWHVFKVQNCAKKGIYISKSCTQSWEIPMQLKFYSLLCCFVFQNGIRIHRALVKRLKTEQLCIFQSISSHYDLSKTPHTTVDFMVTMLPQILIWGICETSTLEYSYLVMIWAVCGTLPRRKKGKALTGDF